MKTFVSKFFSKNSKLAPQFLLKDSNFSKNSHFALKVIKIAKNENSAFFFPILRGLKWFHEKLSETKIFCFNSFYRFVIFFLTYDHPKGTKPVMENEKNVLFKTSLHQMYENCCKFSTNVAKNFVNYFLISKLFCKIFFRLYMVIFKKKRILFFLKNKRVFPQIYP